MNTVLVLPLVVALAMLLGLVLRQGKKRGHDPAYKSRAIMTENEMEFFGRLVAALPEHYIFPQVGMTALLESAAANRGHAHSDRLRIAQQRIDYVVCNRRCEVVAVVELDDKTHSSAKDQVRDGRLAQGGFRTVRFESRQRPSPGVIRAAVLPAVVPVPVSEAAA
jgi:hypothetical protein